MNLSIKQKLWLRSRGGRTTDDVFVKNNRMFICTNTGKRVFVPGDRALKIVSLNKVLTVKKI